MCSLNTAIENKTFSVQKTHIHYIILCQLCVLVRWSPYPQAYQLKQRATQSPLRASVQAYGPHLGRKLRPVCLTPLKKHSLVCSFASSIQCKHMTEDDMRPFIPHVIFLQLLPVVSLPLQETNQMKKHAISHHCEVMNKKTVHTNQ